MNETLRVKPRLPRGAEQRALSDGGAEFVVGERLVARVWWHANGALEHEHRYDARGRMHGVEREWFEDGRLKYAAVWHQGRQHGLQQQWDVQGRLVVQQPFVRGTGLDLWWGCDHISESRGLVDGQRHGIERWWSDRTHVWSECHYRDGLEHGIAREWNAAGRIRRGFPRYWVAGQRVTRRAYLRARRLDPTLPAIAARDDRPTRPAIRSAVVARSR